MPDLESRKSSMRLQPQHAYSNSTVQSTDLPAYPRRPPVRASTACQTCRRKKVRCDEGRPECSFCTKHGFRCHYRASQELLNESHLASLSEQLETLQTAVHRLSSIVERREHTPSAGNDESIVQQAATPNQLRESMLYPSRKPPKRDNIDREQGLSPSITQPSTGNRLVPDVPTLPEISELMTLVQKFFDEMCPLYPVICDVVAMESASAIASKGYYEDSIDVCLTLLLVAIGKESHECNGNHGLAAFHAAIATLYRLQFDFTLEFAQAEILAGIYLYRKSKVLEAWRHIHAGCTNLYVMTKSDFLVHHPELPRSPLSTLEDSLALPLGCEEFATTHMPVSTRTIYTFFLAETGLKAILKRMPSSEKESLAEFLPSHSQSIVNMNTCIPSPVNEELDSQLSTWLAGVPSFLGWSPNPGLGEQAKIGTRLKLLYWFARFSLYGEFAGRALHSHGGVCITMQAWNAVQDTVFAAQNMVQAFVSEKSDPDPILQRRMQLVVDTLESAMTKGLVQRRYTQEVQQLLQTVKDRILGEHHQRRSQTNPKHHDISTSRQQQERHGVCKRMDSTNETGLSKVTVACTDPSGLFPDVQAILSQRLPLRNLHWKSPTRPARSIDSLNIDLVASPPADENRSSNDSSGTAATAAPLRRHQIPGLRQTPYLKIYLLKCDDNEVYKASSRKLLRDWIKAHSASQLTSGGGQDNHDACEWLILHVLQDGGVAEKTASKWPGRGSTSVLEKVKADFNGSSKTAVDRVAQIRLPKHGGKPQNHEELVDQLNDLVDKIKQAILTSFDLRVAQYEEDIREKDSQRSLPGWNFCTFFILKEGLARGFENVGLLEDALIGYDELAAGLESAVTDYLSGTGDQYGDSFLDYSSDNKEKVSAAIKASRERQNDENEDISRDDTEISLDLDEEYFPLDATKKPYRDMILANNISVFDFRAYVFSRQVNLLLKAAKAPFLLQQGKQDPGLSAKSEDLTLLAEVCDRAMEFISMAARTLRYDIERAFSEVTEEISSAKKTAIQNDLVSSWTYAAACQILSQTVTPSLALPESPLRTTGGSTAAADARSNVPKRSSSLMTSSFAAASTKQPLPNITGIEDLASGRGELYQLGRGVLEEMGRRRGWAHKWSDLELLFGDSSSAGEDMDEVSLDDDQPSEEEEISRDSTPVFYDTDLYLPGLRNAFSSRNKFHLHFEVFTDQMFRHYLAANQVRFAKAAMTDIAVLRFRQKDFKSASFFFRQIAPFYESSHWTPLEGAILELYARCLKELDRKDEYVRTLLRLLSQYASYTQSYLSPSQKASVAASDTSVESNVSPYIEELLQASKDLAKEINVPLSSFFGGIVIEPEIKHYEDKDGFQMHIKLRFLLGKDLIAESIKVRLVGATGTLSNDIWLENTGETVIKSRTSRLSIDSATTLQGKFFVDRIEIRFQNLVFTHASGNGGNSSGSLSLPSLKELESAEEEETRPCIWCYPSAHGLDARLAAPHRINLEELRTLEIELDSGRNNVSKGLLRIRPATAGLRLRTSEITVIAGDIEMTPNPESGCIEFVDLARDTSIRFRVPYTVDENHTTLSARLEVAYETGAGRFTYISTSSFISTLPISVNVQDIFRDDVLLSRFTVSPATLVPLRILGCDIPESETYKVESGVKGPLAFDVFPKQPASIMYKIRQKVNQSAAATSSANSTAKQHSLRLTVWYTCIDDECLFLVKQKFSEALAQSKYKSLTRLLTPHIVEAFRGQLSASVMESISLIREVEMLPYDDVHWDTVLKGLQEPLGQEVQTWLRGWHQENPILPLVEDNESLLARHIVISVEVPEIQVVHTAELRLFTDSEATTTITPHAAVGHMVPAELTLRHTRRWCSQQSEKQDSFEHLEFSYEMHVNQDLWLLGGRRRGHFTAQEGEVKKFAVMLLPQKSGHLLLPTIEIKTFVVGGTTPATASATNTPTPTPTTNNMPSIIAVSPAATTAPWTQQRRQIPNEVDYKNHGETLLVLPDLRKTTVSLESGNPGLIESEARIAA
ncbi:hypothetical protein UA08_00755 [Talaromyces atroroseus]|uniref:Zn(2)-C6 fungal-type domain-containing protein n=1 Tax=Talaromyces atroroseus TaxID=1441469 RepID=A0A225AQ84_TALAT|nr:hypothetical protein UA08_00755 [Talaromyces atroroseus]OKL63792.1 hypothetical protein UA08_00755 [Talaromyces atroroseus]